MCTNSNADVTYTTVLAYCIPHTRVLWFSSRDIEARNAGSDVDVNVKAGSG